MSALYSIIHCTNIEYFVPLQRSLSDRPLELGWSRNCNRRRRWSCQDMEQVGITKGEKYGTFEI
jgi:hypothetical protein